jgi:hypothetical protein
MKKIVFIAVGIVSISGCASIPQQKRVAYCQGAVTRIPIEEAIVNDINAPIAAKMAARDILDGITAYCGSILPVSKD